VKLDPLPVSDYDKAKMEQWFPGSPMQAMLHNELVRQILVERDKLEACPPEQLAALQTSIRVRRELLGFLHRNDRL
jgi:hypothetical protein